MSTRTIELTSEQDAFIEDMLKAGEYRDAGEAMRDAIRVLQERRAQDAVKLVTLRAAVRDGVSSLERGDYTDVLDEDLDAFLDNLATSDRR